MRTKGELIDAFVWALKNRPKDFSVGRHLLVDAKTKFEWWIGNKAYYLCLEQPHKIEFGYWQKRRAWRALQHLVAQHEATLVSGLVATLVAANGAFGMDSA